VWGEEADGEGTVVLRSTEITVDGKWNLESPAVRSLTMDDRSNALLQTGDIVVTKSSGSEAHIGKAAIVDSAIAAQGCCFSNFMQRLRANRRLVARYLYWMLNSSLGREQLRYLGATTTGLVNLNGTTLGEMYTLVPPVTSQRRIADFLDRKTEAIDALIAKKERLIELLEEKRTALITHAVTKGLNPDAPMKPSGIEWVGDTPAHWISGRVRDTVGAAINGAWGDVPTGGRTDVVCVRVADFDRQLLRVTGGELTRRCLPLRDRGARVLQTGDLLLEKSGGGENQPVGAVVKFSRDTDVDAVCSNFVARVVPHSGHDSSFLCYLHAAMYTARINVRSIKQNTGIQNLDAGAYFSEPVLLPPKNEQHAIAGYLDEKTAALRAVVTRTRDSIEAVREYRSAVITSAVTGQLDVQEVAS